MHDMSALTLRPEQQQVIDEVAAAFRAGHKRVMVSAFCGFGKCHGAGTRVVMADGSTKAVENVEVGDMLASPTGGYRAVLSLGRGREEMHRITPIKGDSYTVNGSHLLSLILSGSNRMRIADGRMVNPGEVVAVDVHTYLASGKSVRTYLKGWRPARVAFDVTPQTLNVPPYILGAWLGDGHSDGASLTKPDCRLTEKWIAWGESLGCTARCDTSNGTRCQTIRLTTARGGPNPALDALRGIDVIGNKHIPHQYLTAPVADRLELLAGLIDSDGSHIGGCYDWIAKGEAFARQFAFLCRSLGFACYLSQQRKGIKSTGFSALYWRCTVSGDCERIPCLDKPARQRTINKRHLLTGIKQIDSIGIGDYFGFELDGDHLYLLEDFTSCHNTELATAMLQATHANGKSGAFLADRIALVNQTSERFDKYGLDHGVMMSQHWRFRPSERVQVCSIATLIRRKWPAVNLLFLDEAHVLPEAVKAKLAMKDCYAIGLSATPITRGLGKYFDVVVNAPPANRLIEMGRLVPLNIHSFTEPDMSDAEISATGEWTGAKAEERVMQVVGDVVQKYLTDGDNRKFIGFAWSIAHAHEMQRQFLAAGINCGIYTSNEADEDRIEVLADLKNPQGSLRGVWSVAALTRGFDQTDIELMIDARPLRNALHEYVQMLGRIMRSHEGKTEATVFDHSGNAIHFWHGWKNLFEHGVKALDDGKKKPKEKEAGEGEIEPMKCPKCGHVHDPRPFCPKCGHEYPKRATIEHVPGTLKELVATGNSGMMRKMLWPQIVAIVREKGNTDPEYVQRRSQAIYHEITGVFAQARADMTEHVAPTPEVRSRVKANQIRFAKGREAARRREAVPA